MNAFPAILGFHLLILGGSAWSQIPSNFQERILSVAPETDADGDGAISVEELKKIYATLPSQYQARLSARIPGLVDGTVEEKDESGANRPALSYKRPAGSPEEGRKKGYNCLFLGHSYFVPIVMQIEAHAKTLGLENHQQFVFANGGPKGSPGMLWDNEGVSKPAKDLLRTGNVELVALTAHYTGSEVEDYSHWVDLALEHNPRTIFVIQAPWPQKQGKEFAEYEQEAKEIIKKSNSLITRLRDKYPKTVFLRVAQAEWMVDLWRLYNEKKLPQLTALVAPNRSDAGNALFRDQHGHGGGLAVSKGAMLWLHVIYGTDLKSYGPTEDSAAELKALAQKIVDSDPFAVHPEKK